MKYAVVTGSSKGIGKQVGIDFLKQGYHVIFNYGHDDSVLAELNNELAIISSNYTIIKNDFSCMEKIENFVLQVNKIVDKIDVLVLNTAMTNRKTFDTLTMDEWNEVLTTNLTSPCFLIQKLKNKIKQNGNIIFIGAMLGEVPHAISIPYGVSKAGVHILAKYLVKEFCEDNIRVNVVAPGFVETPWQKNKPVEQRKRIEEKIALKRFATPEEISDAVMFIVNNGYINGAILDINGAYCYK